MSNLLNVPISRYINKRSCIIEKWKKLYNISFAEQYLKKRKSYITIIMKSQYRSFLTNHVQVQGLTRHPSFSIKKNSLWEEKGKHRKEVPGLEESLSILRLFKILSKFCRIKDLEKPHVNSSDQAHRALVFHLDQDQAVVALVQDHWRTWWIKPKGPGKSITSPDWENNLQSPCSKQHSDSLDL